MTDTTRLEYVAELVIRRVLFETAGTRDLPEALELAYPFRDIPQGRPAWEAALHRTIPAMVRSRPILVHSNPAKSRMPHAGLAQEGSEADPSDD